MDRQLTELYAHHTANHYERGDYDQAINYFNRSIALQPTNPKFYYGRGAAYYKQDNYDHAILDCDMTIKTNPDFTEFSYGGGP